MNSDTNISSPKPPQASGHGSSEVRERAEPACLPAGRDKQVPRWGA